MRLHRFYLNTPVESETIVKDERLIHQWRNVFRYNVGTELVLFDGSGKEYSGVIEEVNNREAKVKIVESREGIVPQRKVTLYQSLIKKDKMEWVVEKATELGVSRIVPIVSDRSEKKGFNLDRARKIAIEASEQCGRADVPEVGEVVNMEEGIKNSGGKLVVLDSSGPPIHHSSFNIQYSISLFIGPEGGWSEKEIELFKEKGAEVYSLGKLTLRAETAAVVAVAYNSSPLALGE